MIIYCSNLHCPCNHPCRYTDEWFSSTCMHISHLYACLSSNRTMHVKSYSWILRACVGETCFCMNHLGYSPMLDIAQCLIILDINCTCCQPIVYAMHTINPSHAILQWCNRGSIRSLERSDSRQLIYLMYDDGDDGNDDGDDDCGHVLVPLSYYHSLISSYTRVSIVVLINMLIYRMWNIYPLLQDRSDRWSAVLLLCSAIHGMRRLWHMADHNMCNPSSVHVYFS